ncbi:MAG: hypothetical protein ABH863_03550 [Candidatus Micrarchaeota archaeon]
MEKPIKAILALLIIAVILPQVAYAASFVYSQDGFPFIANGISTSAIGFIDALDGEAHNISSAPIMGSPGSMVTYQLSSDASTPYYQYWDGQFWNLGTAVPQYPGSGTMRLPILKSNPLRNEKTLVTLDSNSNVIAWTWSGGWSSPFLLTSIASDSARRSFDVAYEQQSGRAIAVYANTTPRTLSYRIWAGDAWSQEMGLDIGTAGSTNRIVDLFPRKGTNQIMLLVSDGSATPDLYGALWDGSSFVPSTISQLTSELDQSSDRQSYFGVWEALSGDFNVFYAEDLPRPIFKKGFEGGVWTSAVQGHDGGDGDSRFVIASGFPGSDAQMVCWNEHSASDKLCQYWDGVAFQGFFEDTSTERVVGRNFDVEPLANTPGGFLFTYGDANENWLDFVSCSSAANCASGTWQSRNIWSSNRWPGIDTRWSQLYSDPWNPGNFTLLSLSQTSTDGWYRSRIYCDSASCRQAEGWVRLGPTSSATYESAYFSYDANSLHAIGVWHNSTQVTVPGDPNDITGLNASIRFLSDAAIAPKLELFDFASGSWSGTGCTLAAQVVPNVWQYWNCSITLNAPDFVSPDLRVRVRLFTPFLTGAPFNISEDFLKYEVYYAGAPEPYVSVGKPSYSACGMVYYEVRLLDRDEMLYTPSAALNISILNSTEKLSEISVPVSSGIYRGEYALPPFANAGNWLIKALSGSLGKKYFYVGSGSDDVWKIGVFPSVVKGSYTQSEIIPVSLNVLSQKGAGIGNLVAGSNLLLKLDGNPFAPLVANHGNGTYSFDLDFSSLSVGGAHVLTATANSGAIDVAASYGFSVS